MPDPEALYADVESDGGDFDFLRAIEEAEPLAEAADAQAPGALTAFVVAEQKALLETLKQAQVGLDDALSKREGISVREVFAEVARTRHIQEDDPFWALVELFGLLYDRTGQKTASLVEAAVKVGRARIVLDSRILELVPLLHEGAERVEAASEAVRVDLATLREELRFQSEELSIHRAEIGTFISGVSSAFKSFVTASQHVAAVGNRSFFELFLERVVIPIIALIGGLLAGRFLLH